nr:unnamed protein product [Callosobruchus analis]
MPSMPKMGTCDIKLPASTKVPKVRSKPPHQRVLEDQRNSGDLCQLPRRPSGKFLQMSSICQPTGTARRKAGKDNRALHASSASCLQRLGKTETATTERTD